jgi:hypothetical protein
MSDVILTDFAGHFHTISDGSLWLGDVQGFAVRIAVLSARLRRALRRITE